MKNDTCVKVSLIIHYAKYSSSIKTAIKVIKAIIKPMLAIELSSIFCNGVSNLRGRITTEKPRQITSLRKYHKKYLRTKSSDFETIIKLASQI